MIENVLGVVKNNFIPKNKEDRVCMPNGKEILFKSFLVSNVVYNICKFEKAKGELINNEDLEKWDQNKVDSYLNKFDLIVLFSNKFKKLRGFMKNKKKNFLYLEQPVIYRNPNVTIKYQSYFRILYQNIYGEKFIQKYCNQSIRKGFPTVKQKKIKTSGDSILLINQLSGDLAISPTDPYEWSKKIISKIRSIENRKIIFRDHPLQKKNNDVIFKEILKNTNVEISENKTLFDDLIRSSLVVTYSSTSALESIQNSIPTIATNNRSFVYEIVKNDVLNPPYSNISEQNYDNLMSAISNTHYNLHELISGSFWLNFKRFM